MIILSDLGQKLYYGSHYKRLQSLKDKYDPHYTFHFPVSIRNSESKAQLKHSTFTPGIMQGGESMQNVMQDHNVMSVYEMKVEK